MMLSFGLRRVLLWMGLCGSFQTLSCGWLVCVRNVFKVLFPVPVTHADRIMVLRRGSQPDRCTFAAPNKTPSSNIAAT